MYARYFYKLKTSLYFFYRSLYEPWYYIHISPLKIFIGQNYLYQIHSFEQKFPGMYHKIYLPIWNFKVALLSSPPSPHHSLDPKFFYRKSPSQIHWIRVLFFSTILTDFRGGGEGWNFWDVRYVSCKWKKLDVSHVSCVFIDHRDLHFRKLL